jgi:hypothetical protein
MFFLTSKTQEKGEKVIRGQRGKMVKIGNGIRHFPL